MRPASLAALAALLLVPASAGAAGGSIAFLRDGNVWIAAADGTGARQLTTDGSYSFVSAAKTKALLGVRRVNSYAVLDLEAGTAALVPTTRPPAVGPDADLSADGSRLAYIYEYFLDGIQGSDGAAVGVDGSKPVHLGRASLADATFLAPDGSTMIWAGLVKDAYGTGSTPGCDETDRFGLAFVTPDPDDGPESGAARQFLCVPGQDVLQPAAAPDASAVAATVGPSRLDGDTHVTVFSMANFDDNAIIAQGGARDPDWSPDGTEIAYDRPDKTIWVTGSGGGGQTKILDNATNPAWVPFGTASAGKGCVVPRLKGLTLPAAKAALRRGHCRLGKVTRAKGRRGRVVRQSPRPGARRPAGGRVAVSIGR